MSHITLFEYIFNNKTTSILGKPIEEEYPRIIERIIENKELLNELYEESRNETVRNLLRGNLCEAGLELSE